MMLYRCDGAALGWAISELNTKNRFALVDLADHIAKQVVAEYMQESCYRAKTLCDFYQGVPSMKDIRFASPKPIKVKVTISIEEEPDCDYYREGT